MNTSIRVLIVDDSEDDALLLADELRQNGFDLTHLRVDTQEAMSAALIGQPWDIIIADYTMPRFSGPAALQVLIESGLDIPLLLVSGTAEEHAGVDMMRAGAQDFILKRDLSRLAPAVSRELEEARTRRQRIQAEEAAKTSAENYRTMFDYAPVAIVVYDRDAVILQVNPAFEHLFGFAKDDVIGCHVWETFGLLENAERTREVAAQIFNGEVVKNAEYEDVRKDGTRLYVLANITPVYNEQDQVTMALSMITDITERKLAEQREREAEAHKREFYRRMILAATNGKLVVSEPEEIYQAMGPASQSWILKELEDIGKARNEIYKLAISAGMEEDRASGFIGCAVEAMANAYKHARGGCVALHRVPDGLAVVVSDTGPGIEALALPDVALTKGYTTATSLGMGYKVMIEFADRVYLATSSAGTVVAVVMGLHEVRRAEDAVLSKFTGW